MSFTRNGDHLLLHLPITHAQILQLCTFSPCTSTPSTRSDSIIGPVLTRVVCAHIANAVTSARHVVMRNDDRIRAAAASADTLGDGVRDQGYSRAKVLVLVPFKCSAVRVVNAILDACPGAAGDISGYDRFLEEFDVVDEVLQICCPHCSRFWPFPHHALGNHTTESYSHPRATSLSYTRSTISLQEDAVAIAKRARNRPDDFIELMAGNADDCFRMGIRVNRQNVKLFSPFETSDIIVASPLGLKLVLGEVESKR